VDATLPVPLLIADGLLSIIAGSDTTSAVLTALIYFLCGNPDAYRLLQDEISEFFVPEEDPIDPAKLSQMSWLNACMSVRSSLLA
jgi:cytochrome P450